MTILSGLRSSNQSLEVILDRVRICADKSDRRAFREMPGWKRVRGHFLNDEAYGRVLELQHLGTGARCRYYDMPCAPWLSATAVVLIASDRAGLSARDLLTVFELLPEARLSMVEAAIDFPKEVGVNVEWVMSHAWFGKSQLSCRRADYVRFGTHRSARLIRAYRKTRLGVFRVELQLNSGWLLRHGIHDCFDLHRIPALLMRRHFLFCTLNWDALRRRIRRSVPNARRALELLEWERHNLYATLRFARRELRLANTHRYLVPLALNQVVARALNRWAAQYPKRPFKLK